MEIRVNLYPNYVIWGSGQLQIVIHFPHDSRLKVVQVIWTDGSP
jgi:hypothetical protein